MGFLLAHCLIGCDFLVNFESINCCLSLCFVFFQNAGILATATTMRRPTAPVIDSPSSIMSDGSNNWNGMIPRVRRKWVDVVEGKIKFEIKQK